MQSGTLHADEKDYKTSFSYFYEAFEAMNALDDPKASLALKYMLLTKIMVADLGEVSNIIAKNTLKYAGKRVLPCRPSQRLYSFYLTAVLYSLTSGMNCTACPCTERTENLSS